MRTRGHHSQRSQPDYFAGAASGLAALTLALAACAAQPTVVQVPDNESLPATAPAELTPGDSGDEPAAPAAEDAAGTAAATQPAPACVPTAETPRPKPKPKPRPKPKPPPTQPQTAPVVTETPPGTVIEADVKPLAESVVSILGKNVQGPKAEDMGRVVDVLADSAGHVRVAIIDFGGFLGVGNRRIAVDWPLLRFNPDDHDKPLILSLSRDQLQAAPEYKDSTHPQALMAPATPAAATPAAAADSKH